MEVTSRVERHIINKNHEIFQTIDNISFKSKNVYNLANYYTRQVFTGLSAIKEGKTPHISTLEIIDKLNKRIEEINIIRSEKSKKTFDILEGDSKFINFNLMDVLLQKEDCYKELGGTPSQQILKLLEQNWKSFFQAIKAYMQNKDKFLGRPKLPNYKPSENGRFMVVLTNQQCKIEDEYLVFSWTPLKQFKFKTNVEGKLMQVRFKYTPSHYVLEIVYERSVPDTPIESNRIVGIDMGLDNFATVTSNVGVKPIIINGKPIKSINQFYNKTKAEITSVLKKTNKRDWSKRLTRITNKRNNKIEDFLHKASKTIIDYCVEHCIDTVIAGKNDGWKQEIGIGKRNNQNFVNIPHALFLKKLEYKCENVGIKYVETEESYTSGTSVLDNELPIKANYNKKRRKYRGLFISNNGIKINADVNGACQIIKKVLPKAFDGVLDKLEPHPVKVNVLGNGSK